MGKAAHAGDVAALLIGRHAQQDGEVVHRLAYHHVEEFHRRNLRVIKRLVAGEDSESVTACRDVSRHHVWVLVGLCDYLLHLLVGNLVDIHGKPVGRLQDVGHLLTLSVHEGRGSDARHHELGVVGESLADRYLLAIEFGVILGHFIELDDSY